MTQAERVISIAASQIGTVEEPKGSDRTKYGEAYGWNGVAWCMIFVWWCFREAGLSQLFYDGKKTASCTAVMQWAKARGQFVTGDYRPGDVLLYQLDKDAYADHTGIVEKVSGGKIHSIEGNAGNAVKRVTTTAGKLWGAWRPAWEDGGTQEKPEEPEKESGMASWDILTLPEVRYGREGRPVKAMQILLEGYGYSCGRYGCDGECGTDTVKALKSYQRDKGLDADGICGKKTWSALLGL